MQLNADVGLYNVTPGTNNRAVVLGGGGGTFDTNDHTLTIAGVVSNSAGIVGSLTKTGAGTLVLSNANTYTGGTTLSAGKLIASNTAGSATGTGTVTLHGGTLASATVGSIAGAVNAGSAAHVIAPGDLGTLGTLTLGSTLTLNSNSTLSFDLSGATSDLLALTGTLSASGLPALAVSTSGTLAGDYTLATFASSGLTNASFTFGSHPCRL